MNTSKIPAPLDDSKDSRDFEKLVLWVCTLSIAVMAGFLASIQQINPAVQFRFTAISVVAFIAGGVLTLLFLRVVLRANKQRRALLVLAAAIACMLGYFLMGIKNTSQENRSDVTIGTVIAVAVLSVVALVLWRVVHYFESEKPEDTEPGPRHE